MGLRVGQRDIRVRRIPPMHLQADDRHVGMPPPSKEIAENLPLLAAYGASTFNRTVSKRGFEKHGRAMVTHDLVNLVGPVYQELFSDSEGGEGKNKL